MSECLLSFWALRFLYHAHIRIHIVSNNPYKKKQSVAIHLLTVNCKNPWTFLFGSGVVEDT